MEQSSSDNAEAKQSSTRKPKQKPGLKRHRSSEDLPSELKLTQRQCVSIFFEFVKKKSSAPSHAAAHSTQSATQSPQAENTQRKPYRRLCSEPIGGSSACTVHRKERNESSTGVCQEGQQEDNSAPVKEKDCIVRSKPIYCTATAARPCSLSLEHRRMPSNTSSGKTTPAPDPPLFSPASVPELLETYPPAARPHFARHCSSSSPFLPAFVNVGAVESQRHLCSAAASSLPNDPSAQFFSDTDGDLQTLRHSKAIAERLKHVADQIQDRYGEQELENALTSLITGQNPEIGSFLSILSSLRLSWQRVSWLFGIGYEMIEKLSANLGSGDGQKLYEDERWTVFQSLWDFIVNNLARWIWANGGWGAFLKATEGMAATDYHTTVQRPRLWSLSESGSFVNEDGVTLQDADIEDGSDSRSGSETPSDFEGSIGLSSSDDLLQANSLPRLLTVAQPEQADDLHDSGIISSTEQLSLSTHGSEYHLDAAPSSTSLPPSTLLTPDVLIPQTMLSSLPRRETATSAETSHFDRNRSMSLPVRGRGARGGLPRRTSEKALDGLLYTVNISMSAALVFAAVSALLNR